MSTRPPLRLHDRARIAIVNRADAAVRLIHAVRDYNSEHATKLTTIALYTDGEADSWFVQLADESVGLGPARVLDERTGRQTHSYLDLDRLADALREVRADAVWVGWGFVAERAEFAELCARMGITFIGPRAEVTRMLGDKIWAKRLAQSLNIPVAPWSGGPVEGIEHATESARRIGYPLLAKASAGGGGRGIRVVEDESGLAAALTAVAAEAGTAFGDSTLFLERRLGRARHLEVQIAGDEQGAVWAVGVRDCTVQRRRQKMIEESGAPGLETQIPLLAEYARRIAKAAGYTGVGTVEFLYDIENRTICFMEVNPRLQVEHGITELTSGVDLVKLQLDLAAGHPLPGIEPPETGHAIEARLTAEDVLEGFRPSPGRVVLARVPTGPGLRVDTGVREGDDVSPDFDPLLLKIMAYGKDRDEALARLSRALEDTHVVVAGGATTNGFLLRLLRDPALQAGDVHTDWVDELVASGKDEFEDGDLAIVLAAVDLADRARARDVAHVMSSAARGRPDLVSSNGRTVQFSLGGVTYELLVYRLADQRYVLRTPDGAVEIERRRSRASEVSVLCAGMRRRASIIVVGATTQVDIAGNTYRISQSEEAGVVRAPSPSVVVQLRVEAGQAVAADDVLLVLESMKLELPVRARTAGIVREVLVSVGSQVDVSEALVRVESATEAMSAGSAERIRFERLVSPSVSSEAATGVLGTAYRCLQGFDVGLTPIVALAEWLDRAYGGLRAEEPSPIVQERAVLGLFARCADLAAPRRDESIEAPTRGLSSRELLYAFLRAPGRSQQTLPQDFLDRLAATLVDFGANGLDADAQLDEACYRLCCAQQALPALEPVVVRILRRWVRGADAVRVELGADGVEILTKFASDTEELSTSVAEAARAAAYQLYVSASLDSTLQPDAVAAPREPVSVDHQAQQLELALRRIYYGEDLGGWAAPPDVAQLAVTAARAGGDGQELILGVRGRPRDVEELTRTLLPDAHRVVVEAFPPATDRADAWTAQSLRALLPEPPQPTSRVARWTFNLAGPHGGAAPKAVTFYPQSGQWHEPEWQGVHPATAERLELWRLENFGLRLLAAAEQVYLFQAVARDNADDSRLILLVDVRDAVPALDALGRIESLPEVERLLLQSLGIMRDHIAGSASPPALAGYNRIVLYVRPLWAADDTALRRITRRLAPAARNLGLERVLVRVRTPDSRTGKVIDRLIQISRPATTGMSLGESAPSERPIRPLTQRQSRQLKLRQRGLRDPYEIIDLLTSPAATLSDFPPGEYQEYDLDDIGSLVPVSRPRGSNTAGVVVGLIQNRTREHPEGMRRVLLLGDPHRELGALAEPECRRILAALELARTLRLPVEWFTLSSGARISMTSGTENMDWVARALRSIIGFTQDGGEINIVVTGVNVGAQPYFNAEATMLMHTRGILVMIASGSMLLTGKEALDFAGGVSAADNLGIGGYDRVMGPNGQAQYWAPSLEQACEILFRHYEHTYLEPGEPMARRRGTEDPHDRDISADPYPPVEGADFTRVGDIFSAEHNPDRKKPFDIRSVMSAVVDRDCSPLDRWHDMAGGENAVVWDAHVGGYPTCMIGIESRSLPRSGIVPADGPETWTGATLFPRSSKKLARAINAATANRPVVVLANLAGFDGSPESLRELQLEYGAEIGRAVTNFVGPIVFCVLSRYHGGAFVVFSKALNDQLEVIAVRGAKASVIGGSAAAAVVFSREVANRMSQDARVRVLDAAQPGGEDREAVARRVRADVRASVAREFDEIHTIERALQVGSVDRIVEPAQLRAAIIESIGRTASRERP